MTSPSLMAMRADALKKFPKAKWVEYEPISRDNERAGTNMAFGQPLDVHPQFDKAKVVVALDADFLGLDSPTPLPTKQFSKGRQACVRRRSRKDQPAVCGRKPVFADRRECGSSAAHAGRGSEAVRDGSGGGAGRGAGTERGRAAADKRAKFLAAVVKDLKAAGAEALVVAGAAAAGERARDRGGINQSLGSAAVTYTKAGRRPIRVSTALKALTDEMSSGQVSTLVILGGNPVYTAPADLQFAVALVEGRQFDSSGRGRRRDRGGREVARAAGAFSRKLERCARPPTGWSRFSSL